MINNKNRGENMAATRSRAIEIIQDESLTFNQQVIELYHLGENTDHSIVYCDDYYQAKENGAICDLNEGNMPFRPRYFCPDYDLLFKKGCEFLDLKAPTDLLEAINVLEVFYAHTPTVGTFPVYIGDLDVLLNPFVEKEDPAFAKKCLRLFLQFIDRVFPDSFVHANLGPHDTITGRMILELTEEMQLAVPNLTIKYDPNITNDEFALLGVKCMLKTAKPSFANHKMFVQEWGDKYAIASCYNGLQVGGGAYTLSRLRLHECALEAKSIDDFLDNVVEKYCNIQFDYMDKRVKFMVEQSSFFKSNFMVKEGFVKQENFIGLFGLVGLAECVNHLMGIEDNTKGFGLNNEATELGIRIMDRIDEIVKAHKAPYHEHFNNAYRLHAQVGIDTDGGEDSPGTRIPIGAEPNMLQQLEVNEKFHKYFPTGTGDIFRFEETYEKTPGAILPIIKGSLANGLRYFSGYLENSDVVRVTGYLVKKSEIEKLRQGKQSLNGATVLGKGADEGAHQLSRRLQTQADNA